MAAPQEELRFRHADLVRSYRRQHPIALWLSLGIGVAGLIGLLFPQTIEETATSAALPHELKVAFYVLYTVSGFLMWYGLHTRTFKLEAAAECLLVIALLVQFGSIVYVRALAALPSLFIIFLAIGIGRRAWHLTRDY